MSKKNHRRINPSFVAPSTKGERLNKNLEKHNLTGNKVSNAIVVPYVNKGELLERLGWIAECECEGACDLESHKAHLEETADRIINEPLVIPFGDHRV